jgi:tetratricopeptide (TPR) repeat protein
LLDGKAPGVALDAGRTLVRRTLRLVQGHPKLIELAENLAADPQRLAAQVDRGEAAEGGELEAFFRVGESRFDPETFTASLRGWTNGIAAALPEAARIFFHFLCAIEEGDRESWIIEMNWSDVWKRLGRPEPAPSIAEALDALVAAGLIERKPIDETSERFEVLIHPGVAEAGRIEAEPAFQEAVDAGLAATWQAMMDAVLKNRGENPEAGAMVVRAGLAAFPYLSRRRGWETASFMLEQVAHLDASPATLTAVLQRRRRIVQATAGTDRELKDRVHLARSLGQIGRREEAEQEFRAAIEQAAKRSDFRTASAVATDLANLLRDGRLNDALGVVEQATDFDRRAGVGPWTLLGDEGQRLQILVINGENDHVVRRVSELREQMKSMPDPPGPNEIVNPWNVREVIFDIGREAAENLENWEQALDFGTEALASKRRRGAPEFELARFLFNKYGSLLRLSRYDEAHALLLACQAVFEHEKSVEQIGKVLSARADLENELGHPAEAKALQEAAFRFVYLPGDPDPILRSHFNFAIYLKKIGGDPREALAHCLVPAMIAVALSSGHAPNYLTRLAADVRASGEAGHAALPADFDALCKIVEQVEGVRFGELMRRLVGDPAACNQLFQGVISLAVEAANESREEQGE